MSKELTQGEKKLLLQFEKITKTDYFTDEIKRIRNELGIPQNGLKITMEDYQNIGNPYYVPSGINKHIFDNYYYNLECDYELKNINGKLIINNDYFKQLLKTYIFYNQFLYSELRESKSYLENPNLCEVVDVRKETEDLILKKYDPEISSFVDSHKMETLEGKTSVYPISIRIHSGASQNDIVDYIKHNWKRINTLQLKYSDTETKIKNSKTKTNPKIKERNDFIIENKMLPLKEIRSLLSKEKGIFIDEGSIAKIISLNKKTNIGV